MLYNITPRKRKFSYLWREKKIINFFVLKDEGEGISEDESSFIISKICIEGINQRDRKTGGVGMIIYCKGICEAHRGEIKIPLVN